MPELVSPDPKRVTCTICGKALNGVWCPGEGPPHCWQSVACCRQVMDWLGLQRTVIGDVE